MPSQKKKGENMHKQTKKYSIVNPTAPLIEHSLRVKLPNGSINSINVFDYNLASLCHQADPKLWITVQLDDGSHIQVGSLKPIFNLVNQTKLLGDAFPE